jgi:cytochrome c556
MENTMLRTTTVALVLGAGLVAGTAMAQADPDNAIKYRQQIYQTLGANITGIVMNLKGEVSFPDNVPAHAQALAAAAPLALGAMEQNTAGEGSAQTQAKAEIWDEWDDFVGLHEDMEAAAVALAEVAGSGDMRAVGQQVQALGATCKACHDKYRD